MLYNVKTEEKKTGRKWNKVSVIDEINIVRDSLASDLLSKIVKDKTVKKIKRKGKTLTVYYDRKNRAIYTVDYNILLKYKPVSNIKPGKP